MKTMITNVLIFTAFMLLAGITVFAGNMLVTTPGNDTALPKINFLSVKTSAQKNIVSWKAEQDSPSVYYEVQRSEDSIDFKTIAMVLGPKPTDENQPFFEFGDKIFKRKTKVYYRVKQVNAAGEIYYTGIIKSSPME